jgi:hypothetical protein
MLQQPRRAGAPAWPWPAIPLPWPSPTSPLMGPRKPNRPSTVLCSAYEMKKRKDRGLKFEEKQGVGVKLKTHVNSAMGTPLLSSIKCYCRGLNEEPVTQLNSIA